MTVITEVRHGINAPPEMRKGVMFIRHNSGGNEIFGIYHARKNDHPVCAHPLKVTTGLTAAHQITEYEKAIGADTTGGAFTVSLPETDNINDGHEVRVFDEGGNATAANITVDTPGTETVGGAATHALDADGEAFRFIWDEENTNWLVVAD